MKHLRFSSLLAFGMAILVVASLWHFSNVFNKVSMGDGAASIRGVETADAFSIFSKKRKKKKVKKPLVLPPPPPASRQTSPAPPSSGAGASAFSGALLSSGTSPVYDFIQSDYEKALTSKKLVVLYFYANWCPLCKAEVPKFYSSFSALNNSDLVGFRVNYNDSDTDESEKQLARTFGVAYQHTKVFVKNGERILKSPESWDEARYTKELTSALQ